MKKYSLEQKRFILKKYKLLQKTEKHFSRLQFKYRKFALYWLMGVFAGIGFLMSKEMVDGIFNNVILISCVAIAGSIGIGLLGSIDILLYQKLLDAVFFEEMEMESQYDFIANSRKNMLKITKNVYPLAIQTSFYIVIILMCIFVSMGTLTLYQIKLGHYVVFYLIPIKIAILVLIFYVGYNNALASQKNYRILKNKILENNSGRENL